LSWEVSFEIDHDVVVPLSQGSDDPSITVAAVQSFDYRDGDSGATRSLVVRGAKLAYGQP
jgi:hypothetical protein